MRCAARQFGGGASPESLTTNPFHIVHKLQEARRKVCSTTWNSYFTLWNAKVYYILLVLFLLSCAFASKHFVMTVYVRKLKFVEFMLFILKLLGRFVFLAGKVFADNCFPFILKLVKKSRMSREWRIFAR